MDPSGARSLSRYLARLGATGSDLFVTIRGRAPHKVRCLYRVRQTGGATARLSWINRYDRNAASTICGTLRRVCASLESCVRWTGGRCASHGRLSAYLGTLDRQHLLVSFEANSWCCCIILIVAASEHLFFLGEVGMTALRSISRHTSANICRGTRQSARTTVEDLC